MATTQGVKHYTSREDYIKRRGLKSATDPGALSEKVLDKKAHKVELSDEVKEKIDAKKLNKEKLKNDLKDDLKEVGKAGSHLAKDAASSLVKALPKPIPLSIPNFSKSKAASAKSVDDIKELMPLDKPAIFFMSGLHLGTFSSDDTGLPQLSEAVKNAEHHSWKDEDKIFSEILKRPETQPVILVGHSLGGDAVVNLANRLNSLEGGFRKVDLLVTLDSVGFDNDIIPQNVKKNLNFIIDKDIFYNDGPNIARDVKMTQVVNHLRPEGHTDIDESKDVHFEILSNIREVLQKNVETSKFQKLTELFEQFQNIKKIPDALNSES